MKTIFLCEVLLIFICVSIISCKKTSNNNPGNGNNDTTVITPPVDPPIAKTIGFFLDDWSPKTFTVPAYTDTTVTVTSPTVLITIDNSAVITKIPVSAAGQNANSWMTQIIDQPVLMNHLTNLHPGVVRFPGGSISDVYFWNQPANAKPSDAPDTLLDSNGNPYAAYYWSGKNTQSWTISVDSYYNMLQQTGSTGIITVNYAYARYSTDPNPVTSAAHLAADWVRYDNGRTKYWEIGNEDNGTWEASYRIDLRNNKDGQPAIITGDLYGSHFKIFADSMRAAAQQIGKTIYIGAQLMEHQPASWQTQTDQTWNNEVLAQVKDPADFYIIHSYFTDYQTNATAFQILNTATDNTYAMMNFLQTTFTGASVTVKPIALTEWNITSQGSKQQVSFINGMHAAILLGESLKYKYGETIRWDLANGYNNGNDHGLFNIGDEPGVSLWNPRPAFYYMYYFQKMIGDRLINSTVTGNIDVVTYASSFTSGEKAVMIVNKGTTGQSAQISLKNSLYGKRFYWYTLTGGTENGEFSAKVFVNGHGPQEPTGGPSEYASIKPYSSATANGIKIKLPARSVIYFIIDKK